MGLDDDSKCDRMSCVVEGGLVVAHLAANPPVSSSDANACDEADEVDDMTTLTMLLRGSER